MPGIEGLRGDKDETEGGRKKWEGKGHERKKGVRKEKEMER